MPRPPGGRLRLARLVDENLKRLEKQQAADPDFLIDPKQAVVMEKLAKAIALLNPKGGGDELDEGSLSNEKKHESAAELVARLRSTFRSNPGALRPAEDDDDTE